jgi:hypothetical protein
MANKFTTYVPNHSSNNIEIVGLVIMIYVTCFPEPMRLHLM